MKTIITTAAVLLGMAVSQAQVSEKRQPGTFTKIEVSNNIELIYTESPIESVTVLAEAADLAAITTEIEDSTLQVGLLKKTSDKVKVMVTGDYITNISADSGASIIITNVLTASDANIFLGPDANFAGRILAEKVNLTAVGNAVFNGRIECTNFYGDFADDSKINLSGTAHHSRIFSDNYAFCNAKNFVSSELAVTAKNRTKVLVHADKALSINVHDFGRVIYKGTPKRVRMNDNAIAGRNYEKAVLALNQ